MTGRALLIAWVAVALAFLVLLGYELAQWRALSDDGMRAATERRRLTDEIRLRDEQIAAELRTRTPLLRDIQSTATGGDPASFLTRLAELARDKRVKVTAVGPLERQTAPQWVKSWHTVQVVAPYREIRELAARIEADRGVLEDLRLEPAPLPPSGRADPTAPFDEVQARFRMAALELSAPAKRLVDRALGGAGGAVGILAARGQVPEAPLARDPFAFVVAPAAPRVDTPVTPLDFTGTVSAPGGSLAIVNDTIVKVGDVIEGYRIERIAEGTVVVRRPGEGPRTLRLPDSVPVTNLRR